MRRAFQRVRVPFYLTVALAIALLAVPGRSDLAVHVYVLLLAAFGLGRLLIALRAALPARTSPFDAALRTPPRRVQRIPELERMEREVSLALQTAFDLHYRLRPRLRQIAAELLAVRRGIELDASPAAARRALGDDVWDMVRSDREPPRDRFDPGLDIASLRLAVAALEKL